MLCSEFSLVKHDRHQPEAITLNCRRWQCEHCRPKRQAEVRRLCRAGEPMLMVTLTDQVKPDGNQDEAAQRLVRAWRLIVKRYKRQHNQERFPYLAVVEETQQGWPHLHILCRERFISHEWLSEALHDITGSYVVWLTRLKSGRQGANYVSKYLGKDPHHYQGCKRYWRSQDWIVDRDAWDELHEKLRGDWSRSQSSLHRLVATFKSRGYHAIWWTDEHVIFMPGSEYRLDPDQEWRWHVSPEDRRRMQQ
jgi:hypothetical protein